MLPNKVLLSVTLSALELMAQSTPKFDRRLGESAIVREDLFAGFLGNDGTRLQRGEQNLDILLKERPEASPRIFAWQGSAALYRAVRAYEQKQPTEFERQFNRAQSLFGQAQNPPPSGIVTENMHVSVSSIVGGAIILFLDRLPEPHRSRLATEAYQQYQALWKIRAPMIDNLPLHIKGELLAGLAQSAQRTGRVDEAAQYVNRMLVLLAGTAYEPRARKWKASPEFAAHTSLVCMTCHDAGRLESRRAALARVDAKVK